MNDYLKPSFSRKVPSGDTHGRNVCDHCDFIHYENPKIVVGSVVRQSGKVLLCRRAIEPRRGFWTIPAGYLELHETPEDGARREAMEEANADLRLDSLLAVYTVERLSQVQLIYRAGLNSPEFSAGEESLEVDLFEWDQIPWLEIAFPTVLWALNHDRGVEAGSIFAPLKNPQDGDTDLKSMM
ncbi:MAG: NUDIX hydrolase [Pseudomonadota bacterium]